MRRCMMTRMANSEPLCIRTREYTTDSANRRPQESTGSTRCSLCSAFPSSSRYSASRRPPSCSQFSKPSSKRASSTSLPSGAPISIRNRGSRWSSISCGQFTRSRSGSIPEPDSYRRARLKWSTSNPAKSWTKTSSRSKRFSRYCFGSPRPSTSNRGRHRRLLNARAQSES